MKISNFRVWRESFELTRPYTIAVRTISSVENIFVEIESDCGLTGIGVGSPSSYVTGETFDRCFEVLEKFDIGLFGDFSTSSTASANLPFEVLHRELSETPAARAAIDIALHDLIAKKSKLPLCNYLGQKHVRLPTSITIGIKPLDEVLQEADEYRQRHFDIIKLKLGKELELDIERTIRLHEHVGKDMKIRVDLNQGYSLDDLRMYLKATAKCEVEFCEQPLPVNSFDSVKELSIDERKLIAADESLLSPSDAKHLSEIESCGIFNIKLMKCGGIFPARQIAQHALEKNIDLMWGCNDESRVSIAAALHAAFSCENTRYLDLDGHLDLARDIVDGGFSIDDGWMSVTEQPGLGVTRIAGQD